MEPIYRKPNLMTHTLLQREGDGEVAKAGQGG